jgi:16S rRNA (guanine966-N2)-methyltransferase
MRIVGGKYRGRRLVAPADDKIRPTTDRVREAMFNVLAHNQPSLPQGAVVVDLFAGTGAFGLEALSRGAVQVVFVDQAAASLKLARENAGNMDVVDQCTFIKTDATKLKSAGPVAGRAFADLVFADPPYDQGLLCPALAAAKEAGWLGPETYILGETSSREVVEPGPGFVIVNDWTYGHSKISRFSLAP